MNGKQVPTDSELAILNVLWNRGPSTVQEVQTALSYEAGYTTVLKLMQIMHKKGLVSRKKEGRAHRYWPDIEQEETQREMLSRFSDRLFGGSMQQLIQRAITSGKLEKKDMDEIEKLLKELKP